MTVIIENDRISNLPDDVVQYILSITNVGDSVRTSALSRNWRFKWTLMSGLTLSTDDSSLLNFSKDVTTVLSRLENKVLCSVNIDFGGMIKHAFVREVLEYSTIRINFKQMKVKMWLHEDTPFPIFRYNSPSLEHVSIKTSCSGRYFLNPTTNWELPALTKLELYSVILHYGETKSFSRFGKLTDLTLSTFKTWGADGLRIVLPHLSSLTLENNNDGAKVVNLVTPQLKSLTIRGLAPLNICTTGFPSLEIAEICILQPHQNHASKVDYLLQVLHNVKFLTLNLEIIEFLSPSVELLQKPSPFVNLKTLKIKSGQRKEVMKEVAFMSKELQSYFLDNCLGSTLHWF